MYTWRMEDEVAKAVQNMAGERLVTQQAPTTSAKK
jgi:hypothetical protein